MKLIIIAIALLQSLSCFSQHDYDSLRKYSYYILENYENRDSDTIVSTARITGTGYFIRQADKLYFFTARHVLTGTDESCNRMIPPDASGIMNIALVNDAGIMQPEFLSLNVKAIRDTTACNYLQVSPDIIAYEINDPGNYPVYSIENFLPSYLPAERGKIITFGYRDSLDAEDGSPISRESIPMVTKSYRFYNNYQFYRGQENGVDSINYLVGIKDALFSIRELQGHSGSPAFIKDNKRNRFVFLGTLAGMNYNTNNLSFVKPLYIKRTLIKTQARSYKKLQILSFLNTVLFCQV